MKQRIVQRVAAKALVVNDNGKLLILREAATDPNNTNVGKWGVPGGRVEPGELFFDALHREVREEAGLEVEAGEPILVDEWHPVIRGVPTQIVAVFIACKPKTTEVKLSIEHDDFCWVTPDEFATYHIMEGETNVVAAWMERRRVT